MRLGLANRDGDDLGGTLAVGGDLVGERLADFVQCVGEGFGGFGAGDPAAVAGGQQAGGVVGAGVVVDGDGVKTGVGGLLEQLAQERRGDLCVRSEVGEKGGARVWPDRTTDIPLARLSGR